MTTRSSSEGPRHTGDGRRPAETARDEVLGEIEEAETDVAGERERDDAGNGEAGDALTPNQEAQESVHEED
ncbi:hypothetical protein [Streptomyces sp. Da 82-17]|uniref:hypothetical protein n=1 Tax=Streptomyces sp. Da 82-17 TaxID=3377116 RepID=UPI0038D362E3